MYWWGMGSTESKKKSAILNAGVWEEVYGQTEHDPIPA
jgi:hypothetical protein